MMSWQFNTQTDNSDADAVSLVLTPTPRDIGAFDVLRALPSRQKRMIGPFIFFDQMGPTTLHDDKAMDVRPHPHIGISTITWLFEGEIRHQDSLGYDLIIRPGEVNWMTAGSGIVHSERSPQSQRGVNARIGGIQAWVALPQDQEECDPAFYHYTADAIPQYANDGIRISLIVGSAYGQTSPVLTQSPTLYAQINIAKGRQLLLPPLAEEQGIYIYAGDLQVGETVYKAGSLLVMKSGSAAMLKAASDCCLMLLGGAVLESPRHIDWNFVSSTKERIQQAKSDWRERRFHGVPGDDEFIPLPEDA